MKEMEEMTILSLQSLGTGARSRSLGDRDNSNGHARKKLRLSQEQLTVLENAYEAHSNLDPALWRGLAEELNIKPRQVEVWFQNRRARTKQKQTEEDCKNLKRYWEDLNKENQRLKMELMRVTQPVLTPHDSTHNGSKVAVMCSSCNRSSSEIYTV